jgi:hypothetical protein
MAAFDCMHCCARACRIEVSLQRPVRLVGRTPSQQMLKAASGHPFGAREVALPGAPSPWLIIRTAKRTAAMAELECTFSRRATCCSVIQRMGRPAVT